MVQNRGQETIACGTKPVTPLPIFVWPTAKKDFYILKSEDDINYLNSETLSAATAMIQEILDCLLGTRVINVNKTDTVPPRS